MCLKEAVLAAWMANVEAELEWEYHLPTELERGIVRESRVARENAVYPVAWCAGKSLNTVCCLG